MVKKNGGIVLTLIVFCWLLTFPTNVFASSIPLQYNIFVAPVGYQYATGDGTWNTLYTYTAQSGSTIKCVSLPANNLNSVQNYPINVRLVADGNVVWSRNGVTYKTGTITIYAIGSFTTISVQISYPSPWCGNLEISSGGIITCETPLNISTTLLQADINSIAQAVVDKQIIKDINTNAKNAANRTYDTATGKSVATLAKEAADRTWDTAISKSAATLAREARDKITTVDTNAIAQAVVDKQIIRDINTYSFEAKEFARKKAIKVIESTPEKTYNFTEIVYGELSGSNNGVTATPASGMGYTVLTGSLSGKGIRVITFGDRGIIFNVIEAPKLTEVATITFE